MHRAAVIALLLSTLFISCRKDNLGGNCESLKEGLVANDPDRVETAIANIIAALPSNDYNASNINQLCQRIATSCDVSAETVCFDCIETLPSQSEIRITFHTGAASQTKIIDLTYTTANKIAFRNVHD